MTNKDLIEKLIWLKKLSLREVREMLKLTENKKYMEEEKIKKLKKLQLLEEEPSLIFMSLKIYKKI